MGRRENVGVGLAWLMNAVSAARDRAAFCLNLGGVRARHQGLQIKGEEKQ